VRSDAGQVGLHSLEQRAVDLGAHVIEREPVSRYRLRVDGQRRGPQRRQHVLPRLVEELV